MPPNTLGAVAIQTFEIGAAMEHAPCSWLDRILSTEVCNANDVQIMGNSIKLNTPACINWVLVD